MDEKRFTIHQGTKLNELILLVLSTFNELRTNNGEFIISLNEEFIKDNNPPLKEGDTIAFIPPVSGG